jgi:hypothetical protein
MNIVSINHQLFMHLLRGGGLAAKIRIFFINQKEERKWIEALDRFFSSTDDYTRIIFAQDVTRMLLRHHNIDYLQTVRDAVTELELQRKMNYKKQTEHTVHTLYLYFLGIWIFDRSSAFRKIYSEWVRQEEASEEFYSRFSFQWLYASLLHDIGYLFENLDDSTQESRKILDDLLSVDNPATLKRHFPYVADEICEKTAGFLLKTVEQWKQDMALPFYGDKGQPRDLINELDKAPWLPAVSEGKLSPYIHDAMSSRWGKKPAGLSSERFTGRALLEYALWVAHHGYSDDPPVVDHGFASGFLLFQLSSLRYWIVAEVGRLNPELKSELSGANASDRFPGFTYKYESLIEGIAIGCHAAAAHNIIEKTGQLSEELPYRLNDGAVLFLGALSDELQRWQRPPVGSDHLRKPFNYHMISEVDIYLEELEPMFAGYVGIGCQNGIVAKKLVDAVRQRIHEEKCAFFSFRGAAGEYELELRTIELISRIAP